MGSKGSNTTTQTQNTSQTYNANPLVAGAGQQALTMAQGAASQPFQMPAAPVAGFNQDQQSAFSLYRDLQGTAQPYIDEARRYYSPQGAQDFYNPMADSVMANLKDVFGQQMSQNQGRLTQQAGGVGADRIAVGQANLAKQQGLTAGQTMSNLYTQAVDQAQRAGAGMSNLGSQALTTKLQGAGALAGSGQAQQGQTQAELNSPYQQELARLAYPFQTAQYLANITGGLAPAFGGTTVGTGETKTTKPAPSLLSQLFGLGTAAAGAYGSFGGFGGGNADTGDGSWFGPSSVGGAPLSGYAEGGAAEEEEGPTFPGNIGGEGLMPIPMGQITSGAGHSGPLTGGINMQPPPQAQDSKDSGGVGFGDIAKMAMMFLKRGGKVPGYDVGGNTFEERWEPTAQFPKMAGPYDVNKYLTPHEQAIDSYRMAATDPTRLDRGAEELPDAAQPTLGNPTSRPNDPVRNYMAPQDQMPYPDSTKRDWGQNLTRSPWTSLIHAGAAMMSTPGTLGEAVGAGLKAGVKSFDDQRKELRGEEEINNRARALYQNARTHLDQYTKMTPYQRESLRLRNRELDQEGSKGTSDFKPAEITAAIKAVKDDPLNIGKSQEELRVLVSKELAMRKALRDGSGAAAPAGADGSSAATALPDPGAAGRVKGKWYIGPTGQPQQWLGG